MKAIVETQEIASYRRLVAEMMLPDEDRQDEFRSDWILEHSWKVVPVEDGNHFTADEIAVLVSVLQDAGYHDCVAVATEDLGTFPCCFRVAITADDLWDFNRECGLYRFLLTEKTRSWAISCNEMYKLFAGEQSFVEAMLGTSVERARERFLSFVATQGDGSPSYPPLKIARHYAGF